MLKNPKIPSPPLVALQILEKTGEDTINPREMTRLLSQDPGLCAKLLRTLNSAVYGLARPVRSVHQAVMLLGSRPLRSLVLGLSLPAIQNRNEARDPGLCRFWQESVSGAIMARELAARLGHLAPEEDLAVSLLRDLGMPLLRYSFPDRYGPIWLDRDPEVLCRQCDWEAEYLGIDHAEASAALLSDWRLPADFTEPIRYHHHPELVPSALSSHADRAYLLDFTSRLAQLQARSQRAGDLEALLERAADRYELDRVELERFLIGVRPKIEEFTAILGAPVDECPQFAEALAAGCNELVRLSVESATTTLQGSDDAYRTLDQSLPVSRLLRQLFEEPSTSPARHRLLHYELIEVLGRGAMGIVLQARDRNLDRLVAIKLLAPNMVTSDHARRRFENEARFASAVRHENVVDVFAVHEIAGIPFIVMEYVAGRPLEDLLESGRTFSVAEIARIGFQAASGLAAAHAARVIHRDIKPSNLLIEESTQKVRIADFGLARAMDMDLNLSQPGSLIGTPAYMSPEQVEGKTPTPASDLFSLGSVLYRLATGQLPFPAETISALLQALTSRAPTPVRHLNPGIPHGLAGIIERLHEKKPAERPESALAVASSLKPWMSWQADLDLSQAPELDLLEMLD